MNRKVVVKKVDNVENLGQIADSELSKLSEEFEPENYNPIENMDETITIRLTKSEKSKITEYAKKKGIRKSQFVREAVLKSLDDKGMRKEIHEIHAMLKKYINR